MEPFTDIEPAMHLKLNHSAYKCAKPALTSVALGYWALFAKGQMVGLYPHSKKLLPDFPLGCYLVRVGFEDQAVK